MESFGVILSMKVPAFEAAKETVQNAFKQAGIIEAFIPNERLPHKAFAVAVKDAIKGEDEFIVRNIKAGKGGVISGLVREHKDIDKKDLKYDVCNVVSFNPDTEGMSCRNDFRYASIQEAYKEKKHQISSIEFCLKLKEFMFQTMAIEVLCHKAYFVPNLYKEKVNSIVKLFELLNAAGIDMDIEVVTVDNGSETRKAIVDNFVAQTIEGLDEELQKCYQQKQDFEGGKCSFFKSTAFKTQIRNLEILEARLKSYVSAMQLTPEEDKPIVEKLQLLRQTLDKNIQLAGSISKTAKKKFAEIKV